MIKLKYFWVLALSIMLVSGPLFSHDKIAISKIVEHTALKQMSDGIRSVFKDKTIEWTLENAQGNPTLASQIAQKLAGENYNLIIALATPMAQAMASADGQTPILFGAVSDPVSSKLVASIESPGKNISGVTDTVPMEKVLEMVRKVVPNVKRAGVIYNSGEANSVSQVEQLKKSAKEDGLEIVEAIALKSSEVMAATRSLMGQVDVIILPTDNTVISALEAITKPAIKQGVPVIGTDVDTVRRGALAAIGVDWTELGKQLGYMAREVLDGQDPSHLSVQTPQRLYLHINLVTAEKIGLQIDDEFIKSADKLYTN